MYALLALLSIVTAGSFALAFAERRRGWRWVFAASLALSLYTHNWALFFGVGTVVAFAVLWRRSEERPALLRDGLQAYGAGRARLPALGPDARLPGAPHRRAVVGPPRPGRPLGHAGLGPGRRRARDGLRARRAGGRRRRAARRARRRPRRAVAGGPGDRRAARRVRRRGGRGLAGLAALAGVGDALLRLDPGAAHAPGRRRACRGRGGWGCSGWRSSSRSGSTRARASSTTRATRTPRRPTSPGCSRPATSSWPRTPSTGPRCTSTCRRGLRWANTLGFVRDPAVMDWRDALDRLRAAKPKATEDEMVRALRRGQRLVFVRPVLRTAGWRAPVDEAREAARGAVAEAPGPGPAPAADLRGPAAARPPAAARRPDHPLRAPPGRAAGRGDPRPRRRLGMVRGR